MWTPPVTLTKKASMKWVLMPRSAANEQKLSLLGPWLEKPLNAWPEQAVSTGKQIQKKEAVLPIGFFFPLKENLLNTFLHLFYVSPLSLQ